MSSPCSRAPISPRSALAPNVNPAFPEGMRRPFVASDVVRYVGQPVVAVIAEDRTCGADAAELVVVDYEPLPVVIDPEASARDEVLLFPGVGTNVVQRFASQDAGRLQRVRGRRRGADRQPTHDRCAHRAALGRRVLDRRRATRALLGLPGSAPDPRPPRHRLRPRAVAGASRRPRHGRRVRRQVPHVSRGAGARLLRPQSWAGR